MVVIIGSILGHYAVYILGAMGAALFLMLLEPVLLIFKRRSILKDIKRFIRLDKRQNRSE